MCRGLRCEPLVNTLFQLVWLSQAFGPFREQCGKSGGEGPGTRGGPRFSSVPHRAWYEDKTLAHNKEFLVCFSPHSWCCMWINIIVAVSFPLKRKQISWWLVDRCNTFITSGHQKIEMLRGHARNYHGAAFVLVAWNSHRKDWIIVHANMFAKQNHHDIMINQHVYAFYTSL